MSHCNWRSWDTVLVPQPMRQRSLSTPTTSSPGLRWSTRAGGAATAQTAILECSRPITWSSSSPVHLPHPANPDYHIGSPGGGTLQQHSNSSPRKQVSQTVWKGANSPSSGTNEPLVILAFWNLSTNPPPQKKAIPLNYDVMIKWWPSLGICEDPQAEAILPNSPNVSPPVNVMQYDFSLG